MFAIDQLETHTQIQNVRMLPIGVRQAFLSTLRKCSLSCSFLRMVVLLTLEANLTLLLLRGGRNTVMVGASVEAEC